MKNIANYFAINMWNWPHECPDCLKLINKWEDADCINHNGMCWDCFKEGEVTKEQWEQDQRKQDLMHDRYEKHRAE